MRPSLPPLPKWGIAMRPENFFSRMNFCKNTTLLIGLCILFLCAPSWAQASTANNGGVDWAKMRLWAKGMGVAPAGTPQRLAGPMAERAALLDARRNLVEVLEQIYVDSQTTVSDFVTADDQVRNRVYGVLSRPDVDSMQVDADGVCEVIVSVPVAGDLAEALKSRIPQTSPLPASSGKISEPRRIAGTSQQAAPQTKPQQGVRVEKIVQPQRLSQRKQQQDQPVRQESLPPSEPKTQPASLTSADTAPVVPATPPPVVATAPQTPDYTGLVVDARELGFKPSLMPELFASGSLFYPGPGMQAKVVSSGRVRYYRSLEQAQQGAMAGSMPLTIRAAGLHDGKNSSLDLDPKDAALLQSIMRKTDSFLNAGRVAIVF